MKIFVLCGGEGTRLRPHTYDVPKPMLKVGSKPILQYVLENLQRNQLTDLILTVGYKKEQIMEYFGDGQKLGVKIEYLVEETAQNTAGSILPYKDKIKETFAVVMGDHVTGVPVKKMIGFHKQNKAIATVALLKHSTLVDFGVAKLEGHTIKEFVEKPKIENLINIGMYVFEPEIFKYIKEKEDFAKDVFPRLLKQGQTINGYITEGEWHDVGRISDYEQLNEKFKNK